MKVSSPHAAFSIKSLVKPIAACLILISYSCSKSPLPVVNEIIRESVKTDPDLLTVEVSFSSATTDATAALAPLKYNKTSVINFEFDDNPAAAYGTYNYLKTQTFTDGTGKEVGFRSGIAVNSRGSYNNGDLWENYQGNLSKQEAMEIISGGWTLENHGYYHSILNSGSNFGFGKSMADNISENTKYVLDKTGFKMRTLVVPNDDKGYLAPAFQQGIIATTSASHFEGFQSFPLYGDYVDISLLPRHNLHLRRDFTDKWDAAGIDVIKTKITTLFNKSNSKERMLYRLGTHMPDAGVFKSLVAHIKAGSNDNCWITTMQEMVEYLQLKDKIIKKEVMSEGKLLITLDVSQVDKETLFRDISLVVSSTTPIQSIKVHHARASSSNLNGLVNISF